MLARQPGLATQGALVTLATLAVLAALGPAGADECVVSRRLPLFGLRAGRKSASEVAAAGAAPASRQPGGACHMGRLARVAASNETEQAWPTSTQFSTQMCTRNATALTCAELAQNASDACSAVQRLRVIAARAPADGAQDVAERHPGASLCSVCERQRFYHVSAERRHAAAPERGAHARGAAAPRCLQCLCDVPGARGRARGRVRRAGLHAPRRVPGLAAEP